LSARAASCPSCGGEIRFAAGSSLVAVCPHCRSAVARLDGVALKDLGKVADLVPTSSPFALGMDGKPGKGLKPFRLVGRLQLSTGEGTWDEWHVAFEDGKYGWLAEAQGAFYLTHPMPAPKTPEWEALEPGQQLELFPYGHFMVAEKREALYVSAEGELPFAAPPGSTFRYADLDASDGGFATLDYGDDAGLDAFFVGRKVQLADLGIKGLAAWTERKVSAKAGSLNCPSCGGSIALKDPSATLTLACPYCGSVLGESGEPGEGRFEILEKLAAVPFKPALPIGASGTLLGKPYVILGAVQKSTESGGEKYFWTEYLLKQTKTEAYHWLAVSNGHHTLLEPVTGVEAASGDRIARYGGRSYKLFQKGQAKVDAVLGEFYWRVAAGETTDTADWVAPPRMLSREAAAKEVAFTEGVYVPKQDVEAGFALKHPLPEPEGVGANQPWPKAGEAAVAWQTAKILIAAGIGFFLLNNFLAPKRVVFERTYTLEGAREHAAARGEENVVLTEPFEIPAPGNLEAQLAAPTENSWVAVGASLIEEATGTVRDFSLTSDYYHGNDGGESWSEGRKAHSIFLSRIPQGRYVLRLEPDFEAGKAPASYTIRLRSGVPHLYRLVVFILIVLLGPLFFLFSKASFENRRWAESDTGDSSPSGDVSSSSDDD
jgi:predicted RNA-binding Zn-ribbon protein involved in translation (DUF1610 family)